MPIRNESAPDRRAWRKESYIENEVLVRTVMQLVARQNGTRQAAFAVLSSKPALNDGARYTKFKRGV